MYTASMLPPCAGVALIIMGIGYGVCHGYEEKKKDYSEDVDVNLWR